MSDNWRHPKISSPFASAPKSVYSNEIFDIDRHTVSVIQKIFFIVFYKICIKYINCTSIHPEKL